MNEFFLIFTATVFCDIFTLLRNKRFFSINKRKYDIILILICEGIHHNHAATDTVSSGSKLSTKFIKMGPSIV